MNGAGEKIAIVGVGTGSDKNENILFLPRRYISQILLFIIKLPRIQKQAFKGPETPV